MIPIGGSSYALSSLGSAAVGTDQLTQAITSLILSKEMHVSKLDYDTGYPQGFRGFPQFVQAKGVGSTSSTY
jgi:hypothetical protein